LYVPGWERQPIWDSGRILSEGFEQSLGRRTASLGLTSVQFVDLQASLSIKISFFWYVKEKALTGHVEPNSDFTLVERFFVRFSAKHHSRYQGVREVFSEVQSTPRFSDSNRL